MAVSLRTIVFLYNICEVLFLARGVQLLAATAKISERGSALFEMKNSKRKITNLVKRKQTFVLQIAVKSSGMRCHVVW
jgi:hypothetical protein